VSRIFAGSPPPFTVEQLPERVVSFVVEDPEAAREFKKELKRLREEKKKQKENPNKTQKRQKPRSPVNNRTSGDDAETRKIRKKVAGKGMVGALSSARKKDSALRDVMGQGGLGISLASAVQALDRGAAQARVLTSSGHGGMLVPTLAPRRGTAEALGEGLGEALPATGRTGRRVSRGSRLAERAEARVTVSIPQSAAEVTGGTLSKKQIYDVVKRNRGAIRYCYESQLMRYPTLRGKVTVDFIIGTSGRVQKVKLASNKLSQAAAKDKVASCLIKFISRWRFPKPKGGKVRVIYPFSFGRSR
jgi:outer membrane biosynthesis protein TonB